MGKCNDANSGREYSYIYCLSNCLLWIIVFASSFQVMKWYLLPHHFPFCDCYEKDLTDKIFLNAKKRSRCSVNITVRFFLFFLFYLANKNINISNLCSLRDFFVSYKKCYGKVWRIPVSYKWEGTMKPAWRHVIVGGDFSEADLWSVFSITKTRRCTMFRKAKLNADL